MTTDIAPGPAGTGLTGRTTTLLAVAAGLAVANIYYTQPLLTSIAGTFRVSSGAASTVVTATSIGYAAGLALVVPLGDILRRRRLICTLLLLVAVAQAASALAPGIVVLAGLSAVMGVCAGVAPLLVALAATLAAPGQRGRVTGKVMAGTLMGLLLARSGGGLIAQVGGGWRPVYAVATVLALVLALVLWRALPDLPPAQRLAYPALLRSVAVLVRTEPVLRRRCAYGFVSFAGLNMFWTSLVFLLAAPPYSYPVAIVGLFGLAGVAGAVIAPVAGRLVDAGRERLATLGLLLCVLAGWGLIAVRGGHVLAALLAGIVLLDLGAQGMQTSNLSIVYRLRPEARSRITTAYTTAYFLGGFAGAAASGLAYQAAGWPGVCAGGAAFTGIALLIWATEPRR